MSWLATASAAAGVGGAATVGVTGTVTVGAPVTVAIGTEFVTGAWGAVVGSSTTGRAVAVASTTGTWPSATATVGVKVGMGVRVGSIGSGAAVWGQPVKIKSVNRQLNSQSRGG